MGEQMKTRLFIGKTVNRDQLTAFEAEVNAPGEFDEDYTVVVIYLWNFACCGTDKTGRNAYSIQICLNEQNQITGIQRVGHCHMCGGQGADDDLKRFPHRTLEEEAYQVLMELLKS